MPRRHQPRVFCLEGPWSSKLTDRSTVRPLLEVLQGRNRVDFFHTQLYTKHEFLALAGRWPQKQYADYSIGYFAFHGATGEIHIGRETVTLEELADHLRGLLRGKTVYFGSCAVMTSPKRQLQEFRRITGARAVAGYTKDVDWMQSAAFELLLLDAFSYYRRSDAIDRYLSKECAGLRRHLGFKMLYGASG